MPVTRNKKLSRKKVKHLLAWVASITGILTMAGFVRSETKSVICEKLEINIIDGHGHAFIVPADVRQMLSGHSNPPLGQKMADINIAMLENMISHNSFVATAEVFSTIDGTLHIDLRQRKPVLRIINYYNEHFYVDDQGGFMPVSLRYAANVVVATGYVFNRPSEEKISRETTGPDTSKHEPLIDQLYELAQFIDGNPFWDAYVEQVYVNEKNQIELIPRVGRHVVVLGNTRNLESKFEKLMLFYKQGIDSSGWHDYLTINLLFDGQVVCSK